MPVNVEIYNISGAENAGGMKDYCYHAGISILSLLALDYSGVVSSILFDAGHEHECFNISYHKDDEFEDNEVIGLTLVAINEEVYRGLFPTAVCIIVDSTGIHIIKSIIHTICHT